MSEWHSAAGVRRVPMTRALFVAFERVTGTAEYVGDDEGDLRQRILAAGDDTFHYNIVGPYVRAELRTEAARHNFRGVFTCEHCGKPRGAEEHERDSADDQPVQWDVPAEMLAKAHDHIARLRGVLVGCGDHDHVVRESFEAMPEVGDQMSKFAHRRERASHAATGAGGGDEDDVKRCRAVSPSAPGGARTCILTYHATGDHTDGAWTWTQEETCQTTRSQEPSSSLSSSGSSSPGASSPSAAPNASPALTNENVIAAALRLVFDEIGVACAAVEDECTNDPAHRWGARECLRRIAAIREKTIKASAPSSAHTGPMGDGGPPDSGSDRKEGASVSPPLSFPAIGPACPRGGEIVDYCIGLCSCGECPTPRPDFELPASDGRDQKESVEVPRSLDRGGNERRPRQQGVTAGETAPSPSCGWCKGNPIGHCMICQAKPSSQETYADGPRETLTDDGQRRFERREAELKDLAEKAMQPKAAPSSPAAHRIPGWSSPSSVTRDEIIETLCRTLDTVWEHFDPEAHEPNDCICGKSTWHRPNPKHFRSSGQALAWVQDVVHEALAALPKDTPFTRAAEVCPACGGEPTGHCTVMQRSHA